MSIVRVLITPYLKGSPKNAVTLSSEMLLNPPGASESPALGYCGRRCLCVGILQGEQTG